jgi:iron complex transport system ATP-binding protein
LLSGRNLSFAYANRPRGIESPRYVLANVSLDVAPGSFVGILGPNGSGKTTLVKLLGGLLMPTTGEVSLDGRPLRAWTKRAIARRIAMVPQELHPTFDYTVLEMTLMGRFPHLGAFAIEGPDDIRIARDALAATGAAAFEDRRFSTLSGGEKQRVIIAAALAQQASLLLLDEPTASLDPGYQLDIAHLLTSLNRTHALTLVLATHDLNLAASVCRDLVMLRAGSIIASGPTSDVLTGPNLERLYAVRADVRFHEGAGHLTVVPLERSRE